jgi:regulator of PEP synthase PpsR (kinase-PPPase family)
LAYKGYKTANVPFILGCELPQNLFKLNKPLILGLTIKTEILVQIRKNRILTLAITENTSYVDNQEVEEEIKEAKKLCLENNWPVIDVSRRSVEETAALILQYLEKKKIIGNI